MKHIVDLSPLYNIPIEQVNQALDELISHFKYINEAAHESRAGAEIAQKAVYSYDDGVEDEPR